LATAKIDSLAKNRRKAQNYLTEATKEGPASSRAYPPYSR